MSNARKKATKTLKIIKAKKAEVIETATQETSISPKIKARAATQEELQQAQQAVENMPQNANTEAVVAKEVEQVKKEESNHNKIWWLGGALGLAVPIGIVSLSNKSSKNPPQKVQDLINAMHDAISKVDETKNNASFWENVSNTVATTSSSANTLTTNRVEKTEEKMTAPQAPPPPKKSYQYDAMVFKNNADSDNDGLLDILDPNPTRWNVSERDLRAFSTLAYRDKNELEAIFNNKDVTEWQKINENKYKGFNNVYSEEEGKDFYENWDLLEFKNTNDFIGSGLDYSVFGNGRKEDGTYQQIVFAFRGSKSQFTIQDYLAAIKAMMGNLPTQAKELVEQAKTIIDKYNPDSVYATGHSLGGYLSQYFTAYIMQENPEYAEKMKHSAIFNPLKLIERSNPPESLTIARENTDKFVREKLANDDVSNKNSLYKTNSYVINKEFLADGVPDTDAALLGGGVGLLFGPIGAIFGALTGTVLANAVSGYGTYDNAVRFTPIEKGWFDGHKMIRFYEKTDALNEHFAFGSRSDKWKEWEEKDFNPYTQDSDKDGIYDVVENYFGSDPDSAYSQITHAKLVINGKVSEEVIPVVKYQLPDDINDYTSYSKAENEHIIGNHLDNRLDGGMGNNVLFGGQGQDTFVLGTNDFKNHQLNVIADFNAEEDRLDLRALGFTQDALPMLTTDNLEGTLSWNSEVQTLNYHTDNQSFVLAQFLNPTEINASHIVV